MIFRAGDAYVCQFTTQSTDTAEATDADSLPTAIANRNGTDDATFSLTVTKLATGRYKVTGTVPAGYASGDIVDIVASAMVSTVSATAIVDRFRVDTALASDVKTSVISGTSTVVDAIADSTTDVQGSVSSGVTSVLNSITSNTAEVLDAVNDGALLGAITDTAASPTSFKIDPNAFPTNIDLSKAAIRFRSGSNKGVAKPIASYVYEAPYLRVNLSVSNALSIAPSNGDEIEILGYIA